MLKIADLLINSGTDLNAVDDYRTNALHLLCRCRNGLNTVNMVRYLIGKGIDVGAKDKFEKDALSFIGHNPYSNDKKILQLITNRLN